MEKRIKEEPVNEMSWHKVRMKDCVWPGKIRNVEVDNDVIEGVVVSSCSDVISGFLSPASLAPVIPLTGSECMGFPCGPPRFVS